MFKFIKNSAIIKEKFYLFIHSKIFTRKKIFKHYEKILEKKKKDLSVEFHILALNAKYQIYISKLQNLKHQSFEFFFSFL